MSLIYDGNVLTMGAFKCRPLFRGEIGKFGTTIVDIVTTFFDKKI